MRTLVQKQLLNCSLEEAWDFFSSPENLNDITPEDMHFKILTKLPPKVYEGLLIQYKVSPVSGIQMNWLTEITHVSEPYYFVDEQRQGPYRLWHHEHHFEKVEEGVLMTDLLQYDIGKSVLGLLAGKLVVHKKVEGIFAYRRKILEKRFGKK